MYRHLFLIFIALAIVACPLHAKTKSESFINYTANLIYSDCEGKGLLVNPNIIKIYSKDYVDWPYPVDLIIDVVNGISRNEYKYHNVKSPLIEEGMDGRGILKCENNTLDILGRTFFWNNIEILTPSNVDITNLNQNVINSNASGDIIQIGNLGSNVNQIGKSEYSDVTQSNLKKRWFINIITDMNFYLGISLTIVFSFILRYILARRKK